jgi:uncharacterized protein with PIN domain
MIELTDEEFARLFAPYPQVERAESGVPSCPYCHDALSGRSLDYYNGATEAGTDYCTVEITCEACGRMIWRGGSWYPGVETRDELTHVVEDALADEWYWCSERFPGVSNKEDK